MSGGEYIKEVAIDSGVGVLFAGAGGKILNKIKKALPKIPTNKIPAVIKNTSEKIVKLVKKCNQNYKRQINIARRVWDENRTVRKLTFKTLKNGLLGEGGTAYCRSMA